jgi:hypothetical protein
MMSGKRKKSGMKFIALGSAFVLLSACGTGTGGPGPAGTGTGGPGPQSLTVHEWGTFTSVNSSAGSLMEGMHHEEEALPAFVYGRGKLANPTSPPTNPAGMKGFEQPPVGVTQKLETPVLYFYGSPGADVRVRVDFPEGVVSEWYPNAVSFGPQLMASGAAPTVPRGGFMEWRAQLLTGALAQGDLPAVAPDDIWAPSRRVASLPVAIAGANGAAEKEQFIFYRGLGAFKLPFAVDAGADDSINIHNNSSDPSPAVFLLRVHAGGGAIIDLGALPGGASFAHLPVPIGGKEMNLDIYVTEAQSRIAGALERTGLHADEARAMVETWTKSYFKSFGLRILYVVPRAWTDTLLPLAIEPVPTTLVRTLVGRVEVLAPSEERDLVALVSDASRTARPAADVIGQLGRLAEPKLRRALELTSDSAVRAWCSSAIGLAGQMP